MESNDPDPPPPPPSVAADPPADGGGDKKKPGSKHMYDHPQKRVDDFWKRFNTKHPGKVTTILPDNPYARSKAAKTPNGLVQGQTVQYSYDRAVADCKKYVDRIVRECRRINQRYRDPHFDIEYDLKRGIRYCLGRDESLAPKGAKRVTDMFQDPQFYVDEATSADVRQGLDGDCWFMSALCALGTKNALINKVCVARDMQVGVYGFVFHRDGEWQPCIIDDQLYLRAPDYDEAIEERIYWDNVNRKADEEEYVKVYQTGSRALYFASCADENETWLPLLEKAFAKAHGDFNAIQGGFVGEGIEDLTGGVTSEILSSDILDKDEFWRDEIMQVNQKFLFGCSTGYYRDWLKPEGNNSDDKGIVQMHAYSIIDAREIKGERLVKLRNPWGEAEWTGAWSDGSKEWNAEWMKLLDHKFGDDGVFWMSYKDMLRKYQHFDRTRLFDASWNLTQLWTTVNVPWTADYLNTKFTMKIAKESPVVIVLSQLDTKYFKSLEGQYKFTLSFRIQRDGADENDYLVRSHGNIRLKRSCNTDIILEAGTYSVLLKVAAKRYTDVLTPESAIQDLATEAPDKLIQLGLSYDLAHAKGVVVETEDEKRERLAYEMKKKSKDRAKLREQTEKRLRREHKIDRKRAGRDRRAREKGERVQRQRLARANANSSGEECRSDAAVAGSEKNDEAQRPAQKIADKSTDDAGKTEQTTSEPFDNPPANPTPANPSTVNGEKSDLDAKKDLDSQPMVESIEPIVAQADASTKDASSAQQDGKTVVQGLKQLAAIAVKPDARVPSPLDLNEESDLDSFRDFEFDSDLDLPPTSEEDGSEGATADEDDDDVEDEDDNDNIAPWNAVCVLGLRVYSQVKDADVTLQVVRPKNDNFHESTLDRDDPAKGLVKTESNVQAEQGGT